MWLTLLGNEINLVLGPEKEKLFGITLLQRFEDEESEPQKKVYYVKPSKKIGEFSKREHSS